MVASNLAAEYMTLARKAKANGRPSVVSFYVLKARQTVRAGRRGDWWVQ